MDLFREHFKSYTEQYLLIGGGACDLHFQKAGLLFRTTKDLDLILIVEALTPEFINHFWGFIKNGEYAIAQTGEKKRFYRFDKPQASGFPKMIELFSRKPNPIMVPEGIHLVSISTGEEASSLSAILLDDEYYFFALANTSISDGLHHANEFALIVLKAKAFLNNIIRKNDGHHVQDSDIDKHRKDVIRLTVTLDPKIRIESPYNIKEDLRSFIRTVLDENPDVQQLLKNLGAGDSTLEIIFEQLTISFQLG